ncbi:hypothetical protein [Chitinimonas koreensis]|nr:hypothetical protein [Chitinimonas koreensis]QNM94999.1 hypothetical protein H9L41_13865 [Chitinimonas koreensis]
MSFEDMIIPTDFGYQASVGPTFGYTIGAGPMLTGTPGPTANIAGVTDNINFAGPVFSGTYASAPNMPKNTVAYAVGPKAALGAWVSRPTTYTLSLGGGLTSVLQAASGFFEQMYRGLMQYGPRYPQQHQ